MGLESTWPGAGRSVANDTTVDTVHPSASNGQYGLGILASGSADITVARAAVEDCEVSGIGVSGASAHLEDVTVSGTRATSSDGTGGHGLQVQMGASVDVVRGAFENNHGSGVYLISAMTHGTFEDLVVEHTGGARYMGVDGFFGEALTVMAGATTEVTRARLEANHEVGVITYGTGSNAQLTDIRVLDTAPRECATSGCVDAGAGMGLIATQNGAIETDANFEIRGSALCGVQVVRGGSMDLHDGVIADSPIGVNVQVDGFDLTRLQNGVRYVNDDTVLDSTVLPVPDPSTFVL